MNPMRHRRLAAAFSITALLFVGSGCTSGDLTNLVDFINEWTVAKGLVDKNGKPTAKAIKGYMFGTGDNAVDAAIEAGAATDAVRKADKAIANADDESSKGNYKKAEEALAEAEEARPNDWAVLNRQYYLALQTGRSADAEAKKKQAEEKACATDRCKAALYENRIGLLQKTSPDVTDPNNPEHAKRCAIRKELRNSYGALGRQYEVMSLDAYKVGGVEGSRRHDHYTDLANHYLQEAENVNVDLRNSCGGVM